MSLPLDVNQCCVCFRTEEFVSEESRICIFDFIIQEKCIISVFLCVSAKTKNVINHMLWDYFVYFIHMYTFLMFKFLKLF